MKKGCQNFKFKLITISNFIQNLPDVEIKLVIISNFKFEASIQLWGKSNPSAKITKPFKICKDKDEAEVWFSGLKALISHGYRRNWITESRSDEFPSEANSPRTYAQRISPLHSPFGSVNSSHKGIVSVYMWQGEVYIEGRRANRSNVYRGGRDRGGYQTDGRGCFGGRNYNRANGHNGNDHCDHNQTRGNGYCRQTPRQDRTYSNSHQAPKKVTLHHIEGMT